MATMGVDEREYEKWSQAFVKANLNPGFLLLPKKRDFSRKGFCGDSGTLKVTSHQLSLTSTITLTYSPNRSIIAMARRASSSSGNFGTSSWGSSRHIKKSNARREIDWAM